MNYYVKMELEVAQNREVFGWLIVERGKPAKWESANTPLARFFENGSPKQMPNTIKFLEPEGWLAETLGIGRSSNIQNYQNKYLFFD